MASVVVCQNQPFYNQSKIIEVYGEDWYEARINEDNSILLLLDEYIQFGFVGNDVQQGIYTWKITYKNPQNDKRQIMVGHVTLIK